MFVENKLSSPVVKHLIKDILNKGDNRIQRTLFVVPNDCFCIPTIHL